MADLDGDGKLDMLTSGGYFRGAGDGTFQQMLAASPTLGDGLFVDINADGYIDLVRSATGLVPGQLASVFTGGPSSSQYAVDLNGDARPDFQTSYPQNLGRPPIVQYTCRLYTSSGPTWLASACPAQAGALSAGDINGDGRDDFYHSKMAYINDGNWTPVTDPLGSTSPPMLLDLNGDNRADQVFSQGGFRCRLGVGDGTFGPLVTAFSSDRYGLRLTYLNSNGLLDLLADEIVCRRLVCPTARCFPAAILLFPLPPLPHSHQHQAT